MMRPIRLLGAASRAAVTTLAAGAMVTLAACGSQVPASHAASGGGASVAPVPGGRASTGVALCRDIPNLTSVMVSRTMALRAVQPGLVLPRGGTVREPLLVRSLAGALCMLPKAPRGPVNCPAQFRGSLRLAFAAGGHSFPPVTAQVSGCRVVTGLGPDRMARSVAFWHTLGKDLGVRFPSSTSPPGGVNP
jgi:hypothetical protein